MTGPTKTDCGQNAMNLMTGSRVQQTCNRAVEEAVEVVKNRKDGTRFSRVVPWDRTNADGHGWSGHSTGSVEREWNLGRRPTTESWRKPKRGRFETFLGYGRIRDESRRDSSEHLEVGHTGNGVGSDVVLRR